MTEKPSGHKKDKYHKEEKKQKPRELEYKLREKVCRKVSERFEDESAELKGAFLSSFMRTDEPSHLSAYRLCALANRFPIRFYEMGTHQERVIAAQEVTMSHNTDGKGFTEEGKELRDILISYVRENKSMLIHRAAIQLGLLGITET